MQVRTHIANTSQMVNPTRAATRRLYRLFDFVRKCDQGPYTSQKYLHVTISMITSLRVHRLRTDKADGHFGNRLIRDGLAIVMGKGCLWIYLADCRIADVEHLIPSCSEQRTVLYRRSRWLIESHACLLLTITKWGVTV